MYLLCVYHSLISLLPLSHKCDEDGTADGSLGTALSSTFCVFVNCLVFGSPSLVTREEEELLNIRLSAGQTFIESESFSKLLVGAAAALYGICQRRCRGKREEVESAFT